MAELLVGVTITDKLLEESHLTKQINTTTGSEIAMNYRGYTLSSFSIAELLV